MANDFRDVLSDALRYWELRRIGYNAVLAATVAAWVVITWPHFKASLSLRAVTALAILAVIANVFYCAAYLVDLPMQHATLRDSWRRWRWCLWVAGTIFALLLENYWIADEIYPWPLEDIRT